MAVLISQRNRMEASLRRTERTLRTISACDQTLVWANTESALLQEICQAIVKEGGYRLVWVCFAESDEQKSVRIAAQAGHDEGYLKELHLTWADSESGRGPTGTAIRSGQPVLCGSIATILILHRGATRRSSMGTRHLWRCRCSMETGRLAHCPSTPQSRMPSMPRRWSC